MPRPALSMPRPALSGLSLRSLRLHLIVALVAVGAACAYVAGKSSSDELHSAYRDSARTTLQAATTGFERRLGQDSLARPARLHEELQALSAAYPALESARVYSYGSETPAASVGGGAGDRTELRLAVEAMSSGVQAWAEAGEDGHEREVLLTPLAENGQVVGAFAVAYDLRTAHERLAERNRRFALVSGILLAGLALLLALVLRRGIFGPLDRLRLAARAVGGGDLGTRLGWRRRDELGQLAGDFDAMAADLETDHSSLEELAHSDPLTGLANHRRFQELLGGEVERARRAGRPLAVAILDLDDFKRVNEARGHPFGDELLATAAESLRSAMRDLGVVARVGGDEFGLILPGTEPARAVVLTDAARTAVEAAAPVRGSLRCSAGIACYPDDAKGAGALVQVADGALLWAKQSGRGRSRRYDPEHVLVVTEEQREDFAGLIARPDAVRPVFQPIVSLASGEPVGFEALARFDDRPGLPPSWWFSQAHRFGLGAALEAEAVRVALAAERRPPGTFLSINLSPSALAAPEIRELLPADLTGLVIEITEQDGVLDVEALRHHVDPLRARGARIAVDDAGAGYAGLRQVMSMRADIVKLGRSLVADVHADPAKIALIGSLVHFARTTGATICGVGIETLDELRTLVHLGVPYGQGWALARPAEPWPRVNAAAARLCRELRSEQGRVVPLGAGAGWRRGA
ncbi:MAG: EAL domain-containing protein [Thermoleophilaceae bacterium]